MTDDEFRDRVVELLECLVYDRKPRSRKSAADQARDLEALRSMRRDPGAQEQGDFPQSTTTREEFWRREDR